MAEASGGRPVGKTRDTGWQIGVRRTLPVSVGDAWRLVTSPEGVRAWLGEGARVTFEHGHEYALADGSAGVVRVVQPDSHVRLTWHPDGWPRPSTIQVRVIPAGERTAIAFHQEHIHAQRRRPAGTPRALHRRDGPAGGADRRPRDLTRIAGSAAAPGFAR